TILSELTRAVVGQSVYTSQQDLEQRLAAVLPWDVELLGTSAQAIAVAIRRALGGAQAQLGLIRPEDQATQLSSEEVSRRTANWVGIPWRLLPEVPLPPA